MAVSYDKVGVSYFSYEKVEFTIQKAKSGRLKTLKLKVDGLEEKEDDRKSRNMSSGIETDVPKKERDGTFNLTKMFLQLGST